MNLVAQASSPNPLTAVIQLYDQILALGTAQLPFWQMAALFLTEVTLLAGTKLPMAAGFRLTG